MTTSILSPQLRSQAALAESDAEAFTRMITPLLKRGVDSRGFVYSDPQVIDGDLTSVRVRLMRDQTPVHNWVYDTDVELQYRRVPLTAVAARYGAVLRADLPTTIRSLVADYFQVLGLEDRSDQVVDGVVSSLGPVTVSVLPGQFLLHGQASYTVRPYQRRLGDVMQELIVAGYRQIQDFDQQAIPLLTDQLNAANQDTLPYGLEMELIQLGEPQVTTGYQYDNTRVQYTAVGDGYYLGSVDVVYSRYDFGWYTMGSQILIDGPPAPDLDYILDQVTSQTSLPLTRSDVEVPTLPDNIPRGTVQTLTIFFKASSLRYVGELTIDYRAV